MSRYSCGEYMDSNPYEVLGILNCSHDRKLTLKRGKKLKATVHPDKNRQNEFAGESFVVAQAATDFLLDRKKKQHCDDSLHHNYRCFKVTKEGTPETHVLQIFFRRKAELDRLKRNDKWAALWKSYYEGLKSVPRYYWAKISNFAGQIYKNQVGRVGKTYRDLGRWTDRVRYSQKSTTRKQPSRTPSTAVKSTDISRVARSGAVPYPPTAPSNLPITGASAKRILSITETKTVTESETETETETDTIAVTAFGIDVKKCARETEHLATSINPRYVGVAAAAAAGVFVVCVAGGWYLVQRGIHGQQQAVGNNEEPDIEDSDEEGLETEDSDDGGSSDDSLDNEESDDEEMYDSVDDEDEGDTEDELDEDDEDEDGRSGGTHVAPGNSSEHDVGELLDAISNSDKEAMGVMDHTAHKGNAVRDGSEDEAALDERISPEIADSAASSVMPVAPAIAAASMGTAEQSPAKPDNLQTPKRRSKRIAASATKPKADDVAV